ncbi:COQ9 family protein [Lutimaribacter sp. EGI FJ00015]|uniref:COQ9 family protein n=1 Tax=Lutimaribacter degradans TaxID=2945989 RepID=A0ACC5ZZM2_9RHOB|nr:COQ9 family protein [Lutimaribacter sp. EGI FJ00013]MCM2562799.1 COQ9 family protein [Lutimaribacter sp. EGI FJ00013]MCO0613956.1 COQ9 family protein [Lutimaribacter sp. EGI FJ00015]MCO0636928.1 COQ9 family protein [Lutimaribacter sp. EGI FJ00014]
MENEKVIDQLLDAALMHVPFDGWGQASFDAVVADSGVAPDVARAVCPRGAVDLALAYHKRGDDQMLRRIHDEDLSALRFRDRVAAAVRFRIEAAEDKEIVRRGTTLFALPQYASDGARAIWGTADKIWTALGDRSDDVNWYTKRTILSGVYSSTVLYWLGDESDGNQATWEFLDRRIDDVMQFEKVKASLRDNRAFNTVFAGPLALIGKIRAPSRAADDLPGQWRNR